MKSNKLNDFNRYIYLNLFIKKKIEEQLDA